MSGPVLTLTVSSAIPSPARASDKLLHSTRIDPELVSGVVQPLPGVTAPQRAPHDHTLSVKSLPSLPIFGGSVSLEFNTDINTSFSLSYADIVPNTNDTRSRAQSDFSASGLVSSSLPMGSMSRRRSILGRPVSWMPSSRASPESDDVGATTAPDDSNHRLPPATTSSASRRLDPRDIQDRPRAASSSLSAAFSRRSWLGSSTREPSPEKATVGGREDDVPDLPQSAASTPQEASRGLVRSATETSLNKLKNPARRGNGGLGGGNEGSKSTDSMGKLGGYFLRKKQQLSPSKSPVGPLILNHESAGSSTTSLAPPSIEARPSHASETSNSTAPDDFVVATNPPTSSHDPLWSLFKGLDADFAKFRAKPVSGKATVVRATLLPFLRKFGLHCSNKQLRPTALEQRAIILDKWWTGILDMLQARDQNAVPGVDKPCLYEATTLLMTRPEWRFSTSSFCALVDRSPKEKLRKRMRSSPSASSSESLPSSEASFVADSADHNVRNMFTSKLIAQLVLVIDRLSSRHAPISLVNFAGKACAYAFFFCPDVAPVLLRLWGLTSDTVRRVADEFRLPRRSKGESDDIVALFPTTLEDLGWTSVKESTDSLKRPAPLPLGTSKAPWYGPWISRWKGRDSDLFFVFCKYYFILAEDFFPAELPLVEKARAPAFVLVSGQMLSVLDSTFHRQAVAGALPGPGLVDTDQGVDTSLTSIMATPNTNVFKGMSENRLVVLLRDFLGTPTISNSQARHTFAESFMSIMKSSAKRISQFNHHACFTICDFLEEALPIYDDFVRNDEGAVVLCHWTFWLDVIRKVLDSNNTMSEIRVFSLLFSIWDTVISDPARKEMVCHGWLLSEEVFNKFFNNWCPMVRAYYMRLLCWRMCRDTGAANEADAKIFLTVFDRLKLVWSHYLWLRHSAECAGKFLPSTAPSYPTPGKRFMIIRHEVMPPQNGLLVGFDQFSPQSSHASVPNGPATTFDAIHVPETEGSPQYKKKWGLFGKVLSFSGSNPSPEDLETLRRETANARTRPAPPSKPPISGDVYQTAASDADSIGSSPTYEAIQYVFKFTLSWNAPGTPHPLPRLLGRPRLPGPAQAVVNIRDRSGASGPLPPASRPAAHRAVSGNPNAGLVEAARNASPIETEATPSRLLDTVEANVSTDHISSHEEARVESRPPKLPMSHIMPENITMPVRPTGNFALGVKYAGRALAEWGLVVGEYNGFVDRRRNEGVMGLSEMEVPSLGIEGFRKH